MAGPALITSGYQSNAGVATSSFTGPTLSGHVGKFGIMCVVTYTNTSGPNTPSGWTLLASGNIGSSGGQTTVFFYTKASLVSGDSALSMSTVDSGGAYWFAEILVFDAGCTVVAHQEDAISDGGSATITTTAVTVAANETIAVLGAMVSASVGWNTPSPLTQDIDSAGPFASLEMVGYHKQTAATGSWTKTFTWNYQAGATRNGVLSTMRVALGNHAPVATGGSATVNQDATAAVITVPAATDADSDPLTYSTVAGPSHGTLGSWTGNTVTYTPTAGYSGADSFTFKANDGTVDSNTVTETITVTARSAPAVSAPTSDPSDVLAVLGYHVASEVDAATTWHFEWGKTTGYGYTEASGTVALNTAADVSLTIKNLQPGTTYHWRIVAVNIHGTTNGADQSFVTDGSPAYRFGRLASGVGS